MFLGSKEVFLGLIEVFLGLHNVFLGLQEVFLVECTVPSACAARMRMIIHLNNFANFTRTQRKKDVGIVAQFSLTGKLEGTRIYDGYSGPFREYFLNFKASHRGVFR